MQTRREFLEQAVKLLAGGVAAAIGIAAIVPRATESEMLRAGRELREGMGPGIASGIKPDIWIFDSRYPTMTADFHDAILHQSLMRLDNCGICLRSGELEEAYHHYALALGKTDWELTESERRAAFLNAALDMPDVKVCSTLRNYWGP